ncbi:MAG: MmgE/PrpD family protein, partial [Anaerolineae bacterium]
MDVINKLASNIVNTRYEDIPREHVEVEKLAVLDIIGVTAAGATSPGCEALVEYARETGGREESTILMYGDRVPAEIAALVNGTLARALDFEVCGGGPSHSHAPCVPTAFAVGEKVGGVSGQDLLAAMVLGTDISYRIANSWQGRSKGWDISIAVTVFGSAAVAGRLFGFDEKQMVNTFGIVLGQVAGTPQPAYDGALTARLTSGLAARIGVFSALLARKGITGSKEVMEGPYGYYNTYARGEYDRSVLLDGLGQAFHSTETPFKMYPCHAVGHPAVEGMIELATKYDIKPEEVEEIKLDLARGGNFDALLTRPFELREIPQVDAQFSHPYVAASALLRRSCTLEHFTDEYVLDPLVQDLVAKVKVEQVLDPPSHSVLPVRSGVVKKDGTCYSVQIDYWRGSPFRPVGKEDVVGKFRDNIEYSRKSGPGLSNK